MTGTDKIFDTLLKRYRKVMEKDIKSRLMRAKDIEYVYDEIEKELNFIIGWEKTDKHREGFNETFMSQYKQGEPISEIFKRLRESYGIVEDILPFRRVIENKRITLYISEEQKKLRTLSLNERKLTRYFVRYIAQIELRKRLSNLLDEIKTGIKSSKPALTYKIQWTGKKDNKNEFVQLIYGLYEAGLLNEGKGEITKIVKSLAEVLDVKLSDNWQSNHSKSIHNANRDYEPAIFDQIKEAYKSYFLLIIEGKRKKK